MTKCTNITTFDQALSMRNGFNLLIAALVLLTFQLPVRLGDWSLGGLQLGVGFLLVAITCSRQEFKSKSRVMMFLWPLAGMFALLTFLFGANAYASDETGLMLLKNLARVVTATLLLAGLSGVASALNQPADAKLASRLAKVVATFGIVCFLVFVNNENHIIELGGPVRDQKFVLEFLAILLTLGLLISVLTMSIRLINRLKKASEEPTSVA